MNWRSTGLLALSAVLCGLCGCGESEPEQDPTGETACVSDAAFFRDEVQPKVLGAVCQSCHTRGGLARHTDFILEPQTHPRFEEENASTLSALAGLERDGMSIVLLKPLGLEDHGGGEILAEDSEEYQLLERYVARLADPVGCDRDGIEAAGDQLELLTPEQTLRKGAVMLVGRLPTAQETAAVRSGGEPALRTTLRAMMEEEAFLVRVRELYNDLLLTDRFARNSDAIGAVDEERFLGLYWYEGEENGDRRGLMASRVNTALAREPLEIILHVVRNDRPFTEILTGDYTMVNDYSGMSLGVADSPWPDTLDPETLVYRPARLDGIPHAGVLTTAAFMNRYPTTNTNRNRHRTWAFMSKFMATDILQFADRPIDPSASEIHNPTQNDSQCTVCHALMDPIAGTFQNWDNAGRYRPPEDGWFPDLPPPGFDRGALPAAAKTSSLAWLAEQAVQDERFSIATVRTILAGMTGLDLLDGARIGADPARKLAFARQRSFVVPTAALFRDGDYNLKTVFEEVLMSHYFRAAHDLGADDGALFHAGTAHLLTPEELTRKIEALTGRAWADRNGRHYLLADYELLYGGIDSAAVTDRLDDPNGIMGAIGLRMAMEVSCTSVAPDLVLPPHQRRLFPWVEPSFEPETDEGFDIPEAQSYILENIRHLHARILGEDLPVHHEEIRATYALWYETWAEGKAAVAAGEQAVDLPGNCRADGGAIPEGRRVRRDANYTIRAWLAVMTYLLSDYQMFYE
jgi:hypothetical protein